MMGRWLVDGWNSLRFLFRRGRKQEELEDEMACHIEEAVDDLVEQGMDSGEARKMVLREFGGVEQLKEECRDSWGTRVIMDWVRDTRYSIRALWRNKGFAVVSVLTLALGIGASSAVFSLVQGILLSPPPYSEPERLALVTPARTDGQAYNRGWPAAQWMEWRDESRSFESIVGYGWTFNFLILPDGSESIEGMWVSQGYFELAGIRPFLGRPFNESDYLKERVEVIVLGYDLWQERFGGEVGVIGETVRISRFEQPLTVVGVMPPDVRFLPSPSEAQEPNYDVDAKVDYWLPDRSSPENLNNPSWDVVGRMRDGVSIERAQAELRAMTSRQAQDNPNFEGIAPLLRPLETHMDEEGWRLLAPLAGAVALVFLIACGNTSGLLLARGLRRKHQYAVRSALGARSLQLCRPVFAESVFLAVLSGVMGVLFSAVCVKLFKTSVSMGLPRLDTVQMAWPVIVFGFVVALLAGLLAGWFPAWHAVNSDPVSELKGGSRTGSVSRAERRWLSGVATAQIALTLALLVGAGLLVQSVRSLSNVDPGYTTENVLTMSVTAIGPNRIDFHRQALERLSGLPGVESAAFGWGVPLTGNKWNTTFEIEGQPNSAKLRDRISLPSRAVSTDYFETLGQSLSAGRNFRPTDDRKAQSVAIVNQAMVDRYLQGEIAVGRKLRFSGDPDSSIEIVGVLENARTDALTDLAEPELYFSFWQRTPFSKHLIVGTSVDPEQLAVVVERELRSIDPIVAVENIKPLEQVRAESVASRTVAMRLLVGFALVACLLAVIGIYGVVSLVMDSRRGEVAVRMAVGAQRSDVLRLILSDGARLAAAGIGAGVLVALILAGALKSFLFNVGPADPMTLAGMAVAVLGITLATSFVPARKATCVDPMDALRAE